jgi:DNA replication initiation complex subunit (GINS family)
VLRDKIDTLNDMVVNTFQHRNSFGEAIRDACKEVLSEPQSLMTPEKPPAQEKPSILKTVEDNKAKIAQTKQPGKQKKNEISIE